jgi:glyoxylase-like metal-dependent hydrolase (beta-lactamase superfamily II)
MWNLECDMVYRQLQVGAPLRGVLGVTAIFLMASAGIAEQNQQASARQSPPSPGFDNIEVKSLHVQGNVWMLVGGPFNAAVQIGDDGVLVVDTMVQPLADKMLAEVKRLAGDKTIRYIINTHAHPDHTGGNETVALAGRSIVAGNFAGQVGPEAANSATIFAHENVLNRMSGAGGPEGTGNGGQRLPFKALPTDTFFDEEKDLFFNGEGIQLIHIPNAHTDGDIIVWFRKSDVVVAGDLFMTTTYPIIATEQGGNLNGIVTALNRILDITIPKDRQEEARTSFPVTDG